MTKRSTTKYEAPVPTGRRARLGVRAAVWSGLLASALVPACGGGSNNTTCGEGTEKKGDTCIAKAAVQTGLDAGSDGAGGSVSDASSGGGGGPSTGGVTAGGGSGGGSGGTSSGGVGGSATGGKGGTSSGGKGGGGAGGALDAGSADRINFGGITAVAPADPGGTAAPSALLITWDLASYPLYPNAAIHYEVFAATTAGNETYSTPVAVAPPGATSVLLEGQPNTAVTYFVVRAVSDVGDARDRNTVEANGTPAADTLPPTFGGAKTATAATSSSVLVSWDPASDNLSPSGAITYRVYWTETLGGTFQLGAVTHPGVTQATVSGLTKANHAFFFRVDAVDAAGNVYSQSAPLQGSTGKDATPPVFAGCSGTMNPTAAGGTVFWDPATDDTTPQSQIKYNIYAFDVPVTKDTTFTTPAGTFTGVKSGFITSLLPSGNYRIVCRAMDNAGNEDTNRAEVLLNTTDDAEPPTFTTGFASAVAGSTTVDMTWPQAHDNETPDAAIQYVVYGSTTPGTEDLTTPIFTWTGTTGATLMKEDLLKALPVGDGGVVQKVSNTDFYLVVAAQDLARNVSAPLPEVHVTTLISFSDDVQPVFTIHCALSGCHVHPTPLFSPPQGQVLEAGYTWDSIVNQVAGEGGAIGVPNIKRIDGTSTKLSDSYLWRKINGGLGAAGGNISGNQMPPPQTTGPQLRNPQDFDIIKTWILQGALNN